MIFIGIWITLCWKIFYVESAMFPLTYTDNLPPHKNDFVNGNLYDNPIGVFGLRDLQKTTHRSEKSLEYKPFGFPLQMKELKKPCSVMVVSSGQSPAMQSLLRKYRYDAHGVLIPSSVKYYIKMPQDSGSAPILVPLTGRAFSPLGGFVRYYKEVPPIPPSL